MGEEGNSGLFCSPPSLSGLPGWLPTPPAPPAPSVPTRGRLEGGSKGTLGGLGMGGITSGRLTPVKGPECTRRGAGGQVHACEEALGSDVSHTKGFWGSDACAGGG